MFKNRISISKLGPVFLLVFLGLSFFWQFFLRGLLPIPADIIVGIYYPWRDHLWQGLTAGVPVKNGLLADVVAIIYPWRIYGIELLKKGLWPLWIPQTLAGAPLLANFQSALFYPFNLLFFLFSYPQAWSFYILLQPVLASLFCFFYLRGLKISLIPSLMGSFIFAFSGFMLVWLEYGIIGHAGLWLPLILLAIDKILDKTSVFWVGIGSLGISFSFLAGYPQLSVFLIMISFIYFLWRIFNERKLRSRKSFLAFLVFFVFGLGLAAVQLLPGLELWRLSIRQIDTSAAAFNYGLNPLQNLILLIAPDFFGNPATGNFWGWGAYNESAFYVSLAGLFLALIALFNFKEKRSLFFKFLFLFSLLMAFANPFSNLIYELRLPLLASTSGGRFFFITDFCLAILAAFGGEWLLKKKARVFPRPLVLIFFLCFLLLGIIFLRPELWPGQDLLTNLSVARRNLILPTGLLIGTLILFFFIRRVPFLILKKMGLGLIFLLIIFDLFRFGYKYNPFTPQEYLYPETKLTDFLKEQSDLSRFTGLIPPSVFIPYRLSSPEGYDPLVMERYSQFANQINEEEFHLISAGRRWVEINRPESPLLDLLGSKYLLSLNPQPKSDWDPWYFQYPEERYQMVFQFGYSQVYENKEVLPRAFLVHDFQVLDDEAILKTLRDKDFNPRETLILEEEPLNLPLEEQGEEVVTVDSSLYFDNQVLVRTKALSDGFLFLSDNDYPGWKAYLDDRETKIYRANYTFRAVFVPQGEHEVKFLFEPQSFKIGLRVSILTLSALIGLLLYGIIRSRSSSSQRAA